MNPIEHSELKTIVDFIEWTANEFEKSPIFYGHGTDNPGDEALYLIFSALHLPLGGSVPIDSFLDIVLSEEQKQALIKLVHMRIEERIPVAYLTHEAWFAGLPFYVDERVLIPRSPIAELIEQRFMPWMPEDQPVKRILDMGTGSACIACACAVAFPEAIVDASDISEEALAVAKINVEQLELTDRVKLLQSDVFSHLQGQSYDIIVTNPPYVDAAEMADLPPEYHHEPRLGLASGQDGLDCVRQILADAKNHLNPKGLLVVEVGFSADALNQAFPHLPFTWIEFQRGGEGVFILYKEDL